MNSEKTHLIIVGFGPVASYKYSRSMRAAMERGELDSYSIVDLESQRNTIFQRIKGLPAKPKHVYFIPDPNVATETWADISPFKKICRPLLQEFDRLKVLITTEPKAHEAYLSFCIDQNIDSLITKPIILPMKDKLIDYSAMLPRLADLVARAERGSARHAVLCLGRYHEVYEKMVREPIQERMQCLQAPITSLHLKTSSGVWNLADEFYSREDHPYKYGYGMLMHGAYHYVDVVSQFLQMNKSLLAKDDLSLSLTSFSAFPKDQSLRIPETLHEKLEGYTIERSSADITKECLGETDIVSIFSLRNKTTGQVLTLGSLSLEQTTPGMRHWAPFPVVPYNINGRLHCTDLDVQLSTVFSINGRVVKFPMEDKQGPTDLRGKNYARVTTRSNALLLGDNEFYSEKTLERPYGNSFSYSAETDIFDAWLRGQPTKSDLSSHLTTAAVIQAIAESIHNNGQTYTIDFPYVLDRGTKVLPVRPENKGEKTDMYKIYAV